MFDNIGSAVKEIVKETEEAAEKTLIDAGKFAREAALKTTKFKVSDTFRQATQFQRVDKLSGFVLADKPYVAQFAAKKQLINRWFVLALKRERFF